MDQKNDTIYWDKMSRHYDQHTRKSAPMYERMIRLIKQDAPNDAVILDIGTGTGEIPLKICRDVRQIEAIDFSEDMIAIAKTKAASQGIANVTFLVGDSSRVPYEDETFDVVIIANLLHVVQEPGKVLVEAFRVLKGTGILFVPTFVHNESLITKMISWILQRKGHPIYTRFDSASLKAFLEHHRFEVIHQTLLKNIMPLSFIKAKKRTE